MRQAVARLYLSAWNTCLVCGALQRRMCTFQCMSLRSVKALCSAECALNQCVAPFSVGVLCSIKMHFAVRDTFQRLCVLQRSHSAGAPAAYAIYRTVTRFLTARKLSRSRHTSLGGCTGKLRREWPPLFFVRLMQRSHLPYFYFHIFISFGSFQRFSFILICFFYNLDLLCFSMSSPLFSHIFLWTGRHCRLSIRRGGLFGIREIGL